MTERKSTPPRKTPPQWEPPSRGCSRRTGAKPTPRFRLAASKPFHAKQAPATFGIVPGKLSMWGNDQHGDCVTSEEAYSKACDRPEDFIPDDVVMAWASRHGVLEGADLAQVMDYMQKDGFKIGSETLNDGPYAAVDFSNADALASAIYAGVVKIGIDSSALPASAGNQQGWFAQGGSPGSYGNQDHCVALSGYGDPEFLFKLIGVPVPSEFKTAKKCFILFTWSTVGVVDHDWLMSCCGEAWVRTPDTVFDPPLTPPAPPPTPEPPSPPMPPVPVPPEPPIPPAPPEATITFTLSGDLKAGTYVLGGGGAVPTEEIQKCIDDLQRLLPQGHPLKAGAGLAKLTPQQWQTLLALLMQILPMLIPLLP